jgi:dipeptidyl aminopeptidase/acylaminoacyl peptidase
VTEYRSVLERAGSNAPQPDLQVERVLRRRDRRQRNQRISAGALGVIVTLALGTILVRSLTSEPIPADPPVEPRPAPAASGTLAYALDGDIYVSDRDGSNAVRVADGVPAKDCSNVGGYWAEGSIWSPDGRYLAYRYSDCSGEEFAWGGVVISDAEGNVLATFPTEAGWSIAWSPDSTGVAVWDGFGETEHTIGVYGLDGARQTQLTMPSGWTSSGDHDPAWMPDGTSLMVGNVELPLDDGSPRQLPLPAQAWTITYSPDGSHVAYVDHRSLTVARSDGSEPREVFEDWAPSAVWSPTGDRIAFATSVRGSASAVRLFDVVTGSGTLLTEAERGTFLSVIGFSPRGNRILYSRTEDRGRGESSLWSIGVDGSDARLVIAGTIQGDWLSPSQMG